MASALETAPNTTALGVVDAEQAATHRRRDKSGSVLRQVSAGLVGLAVLDLAVLGRHSISLSILVLGIMFVVPGALLLRALGILLEGARWLVCAVGASIALLTFMVLAVNQLLPPFGNDRPLTTGPLLTGLNVLLVGLAAACLIVRAGLPRPRIEAPPVAAVTLLAPLLAAGGVERIDNDKGITLLVAALSVSGLSMLAVLILRGRSARRAAPWVLYSAYLALLLSYSMHGPSLYGFDIQQEFGTFQATHAAARWVVMPGNAYAALLSITALPTALAELTGFGDVWIFKIVYPALFGLMPVGVYVLATRWLRPKTAFLGASLVVLQAALVPEIPALARQEIGLLLFIALLLVAFTPRLPRVRSQLLLLVLALGLVLSHYSTGYITVLALVGITVLRWIFVAFGRLRRRSGPRSKPVFALLVVVAMAAASYTWNGPITHSTGNVSSFGTTLATEGVQILPNKGNSLLQTWLGGNVTQDVPPKQFFADAAAKYGPLRTWLIPYGKGAQANFPAVASTASSGPGLLPSAATPWGGLVTTSRQLVNLGFVVGAVLLLVRLRRRKTDLDLGLLVVVLLGVTALARVSSSFANAYNPERLALQTSCVLVVGLGVLLESLQAKISRGSLGRAAIATGATGLLFVAYADSSGLVPALTGSAPGNLQTRGEYHERFYTSAQDMAAARWLGDNRKKDAPIFTDRYGLLTLLADSGVTDGLFSDLTPKTLDQRAYVFAPSRNIVDGRARGGIGDELSTYVYPTVFLNRYKSLIYSTGTSEVFE
ncbi:MAG: hypothetical protein QOJ11_889 [Frankiales bacterium]|jgi:uncharacterized membrane protein|nr:hypothetical protein [Frankiales bacterium]